MKAVLVAMAGDRKLYYDIDAKSGENDGALVTSDGRVMPLNFFSFVNKTRGLKKITASPFHNFLWAAPSSDGKKKWVDTFLNKEKQIGEELLDGVKIKTSLDEKSSNK